MKVDELISALNNTQDAYNYYLYNKYRFDQNDNRLVPYPKSLVWYLPTPFNMRY